MLMLDEVDTWPDALRSLLAQRLAVLREYEEFERKRYADRGHGRTERELRADRNPHVAARRWTLQAIQSLIAPESVIAYHCTRLTLDEIVAIREAGIHPLSAASLRRRLDARVAVGDLSRDDVEELFSKCEQVARQDMRADTIWGVLGKSALEDEDGLGNPLRFWGGEVLLQQDHRHRLSRIGTACIVEAQVPVADLRFSIARGFLDRYLFMNNVMLRDDGAIDVCVSHAIPAERVHRVIQHGSAEFEQLTKCSAWTIDLR